VTDTLKIMPVDLCGAIGKCMSHPSSYASSMIYGAKSPTAIANKALQELTAARAKDVAADCQKAMQHAED
jgi:hypothetical protein